MKNRMLSWNKTNRIRHFLLKNLQKLHLKNKFIELISASRHFLLQISLQELMAIWYRLARGGTQERLIHL